MGNGVLGVLLAGHWDGGQDCFNQGKFGEALAHLKAFERHASAFPYVRDARDFRREAFSKQRVCLIRTGAVDKVARLEQRMDELLLRGAVEVEEKGDKMALVEIGKEEGESEGNVKVRTRYARARDASELETKELRPSGAKSEPDAAEGMCEKRKKITRKMRMLKSGKVVRIDDFVSGEELFASGDECCMQNRYAEAVLAYDEIIKTQPKNLRAWRRKGAACYSGGRYVDAARCCERLVELGVEDETDLSEIILECYERAAKGEPKNRLPQIELAGLYEGRENFAEAIKCYLNLAELEPQKKRWWSEKVVEAGERAVRTVDLHERGAVYENMAAACVNLERRADAIKYNEKCIGVAESEAQAMRAWNNLAAEYRFVGDDKMELKCRLELAVLAATRGEDREKANKDVLDVCGRLLKRGWGDQDVLYTMAKTYFDLKDFGAALKRFGDVIGVAPIHRGARIGRAMALKGMGRFMEAASCYEKLGRQELDAAQVGAQYRDALNCYKSAVLLGRETGVMRADELIDAQRAIAGLSYVFKDFGVAKEAYEVLAELEPTVDKWRKKGRECESYRGGALVEPAGEDLLERVRNYEYDGACWRGERQLL